MAERTRTMMRAFLGAATLLAGGCASEGPPSPAVAERLDQARAAYARGDDVSTIGTIDILLREHPPGHWLAEAHYYRGRARQRAGAHEPARRDLERAAAEADSDDLAAGAEIALGDLAAEAGQWQRARTHYERALATAPTDAHPTDYILYRLGCVLQRMGRWPEADRRFARLLAAFPGSELAGRAAPRINASAWTILAGAFAEGDRARRAAAALGPRPQPETTPAMRRGRPVFLVRTGRFETYHQAVAALSELPEPWRQAVVTVVD